MVVRFLFYLRHATPRSSNFILCRSVSKHKRLFSFELLIRSFPRLSDHPLAWLLRMKFCGWNFIQISHQFMEVECDIVTDVQKYLRLLNKHIRGEERMNVIFSWMFVVLRWVYIEDALTYSYYWIFAVSPIAFYSNGISILVPKLLNCWQHAIFITKQFKREKHRNYTKSHKYERMLFYLLCKKNDKIMTNNLF